MTAARDTGFGRLCSAGLLHSHIYNPHEFAAQPNTQTCLARTSRPPPTILAHLQTHRFEFTKYFDNVKEANVWRQHVRLRPAARHLLVSTLPSDRLSPARAVGSPHRLS